MKATWLRVSEYFIVSYKQLKDIDSSEIVRTEKCHSHKQKDEWTRVVLKDGKFIIVEDYIVYVDDYLETKKILQEK